MDDDPGMARYIEEVGKMPFLTRDEEYSLAKRWRDHGDRDAADMLVKSYLRLVVKIAMKFRHYDLPIGDLVSQGSVGLMKGVEKFDPDRGFCLATYAQWWIRASIQEFILNSWSLVKMGTTKAQRKLFFGLRRAKNQIGAFEEELKPGDLSRLAVELEVSEEDVASMDRRLRGDASLNVPLGLDGEDEFLDLVADVSPSPEAALSGDLSRVLHRRLLDGGLAMLSERERAIVTERHLVDEPKTLDDLSQVYGVSRERVRQIEARAFEKMGSAIVGAVNKEKAPQVGVLRGLRTSGGWLAT